jgi:hypothetical protein
VGVIATDGLHHLKGSLLIFDLTQSAHHQLLIVGHSLLSQSFDMVLLDKGSLPLEGFDELVINGLRLTRGL